MATDRNTESAEDASASAKKNAAKKPPDSPAEAAEYRFQNSLGDLITTRVPGEAMRLRHDANFTEITE